MDDILSQKISRFMGRREKGGHVGIEIELEGYPGGFIDDERWNAKPDGSLRNGGIEFVLNGPMEINKALKAVTQWGVKTQFMGLETSLRTSTHIHVNALNYDLRQVYQALIAFWLLETALVRIQGEVREGNLFCLRVCDAEGLFNSVLSSIKKGAYFANQQGDEYRYSSVNLVALGRYGSLEFRFLKGMNDPEEIKIWTAALFHLVHTAANFPSPYSVIDLYVKDKERFVLTLLGAAVAKKVRDLPDFPMVLDNNFSYACMVAELLQEKLEKKDAVRYIKPRISSTRWEDLTSDHDVRFDFLDIRKEARRLEEEALERRRAGHDALFGQPVRFIRPLENEPVNLEPDEEDDEDHELEDFAFEDLDNDDDEE